MVFMFTQEFYFNKLAHDSGDMMSSKCDGGGCHVRGLRVNCRSSPRKSVREPGIKFEGFLVENYFLVVGGEPFICI